MSSILHQTFPLAGFLENLDKKIRGLDSSTLSSGFKILDEEFPGWLHSGHLIFVAGRPAMGKSLFGQQIAESVAESGKTVLFVSLEMSILELMERSVSRRSGVSLPKIKIGRGLTADEVHKIHQAAVEASSLSLRVCDSSLAIENLEEVLLKYPGELSATESPPLGLVVVDYAQLLKSIVGGSNRVIELGNITRILKDLSKKLDIPVLCAAQVNRGVEDRPDKRPLMSDLRDSGNLEQDADFVAFIYRDEYYNSATQDPGTAEIICRKNRHGGTGTASLRFDGHGLSFSDKNLTPQRHPAQNLSKTATGGLGGQVASYSSMIGNNGAKHDTAETAEAWY